MVVVEAPLGFGVDVVLVALVVVGARTTCDRSLLVLGGEAMTWE